MKFSRIRDYIFSGKAGSVFRGMAMLAIGTGIARLIGVASIPILTRIYTPTDYGLLTIYTAIVAIAAPILNLRYTLAIPLPRNNRIAINLLALSAMIMCATTTIISLMLFIFAAKILPSLSSKEMTPWWWLIPIGAIAVSTYEALSLWATRQRSYKIIAQTKIIQSIFGESVKLSLGFFGLTKIGLLLGSIVQQSGGILFFLSRFKDDFEKNIKHVRLKYLKLLIYHYRSFPIFRLPSQFLLAFSIQSPAMFTAVLYGAGTTGQLGLALMALAIPSNLIGQSLGQAFYGEIARYKKGSEKQIRELTYSVQKKLFIVGIPISAFIFFYGENIFSILFGRNWQEAGVYASILSPYILLQLTSAPLIQILNIYNSQKTFLLINIFRVIGLFGIFQISTHFSLPSKTFVSIISIFLSMFYLIISIYILKIVKTNMSAAHNEDQY